MTDTTTTVEEGPAGPGLEDATLFELEALPPVTLSDKFLFPPFTVIDRRAGPWQERKRRWLSLGIESELGRDDNVLGWPTGDTEVARAMQAIGGTSVFDPVLAETAYRWWSAPGHAILDPFSGGSVRGVVAGALGRHYLGVDVRLEQVEANRRQAHLAGEAAPPSWAHGDARHCTDLVEDEVDFIFTCPPYGDLERYSDQADDLSTLKYPAFLEEYRAAIADAALCLHQDRFAAIVVGNFRDKTTGALRDFVGDTVAAFEAAGLTYWNDVMIVDPVGSVRLRAERFFRATRKLGRNHQYLLVFLKGDAKAATAAAGTTEFGDIVEEGDDADEGDVT